MVTITLFAHLKVTELYNVNCYPDESNFLRLLFSIPPEKSNIRTRMMNHKGWAIDLTSAAAFPASFNYLFISGIITAQRLPHDICSLVYLCYVRDGDRGKGRPRLSSGACHLSGSENIRPRRYSLILNPTFIIRHTDLGDFHRN